MEGEKATPWPLVLFGGKGFARVMFEVQSEEVAHYEEAARNRSLPVQVIFPEAEVIVKAKAK